ncbi:MAG: enamine deaminase RidA [Ramlibacter sp.]|jgi:2-iminobutanoate/2-iminopropanoate deaminase|nr:enamine deaminase RidA [Ramlibacter sp.]MDB5911921.1 enamine deaminase RidA [Ramlibacter sp.]
MSADPAKPGLVRLNPDTVAPPGMYSQGVVAPAAGRWLHISGQVGVRRDGSIPEDFKGQAQCAWTNLVAVLEAAGMTVADLVKVNSYLTDRSQHPQFSPIRAKFLGDARPASTLVIVAALARPEYLVEIEAVACRA